VHVVAAGVLLALALAVSATAIEGDGSGRFGSVDIARPAEALTFARVGRGVVLVAAYEDGRVSGLNLTCALSRSVSDPIEVFRAEGYQRLEQLATTSSPDCAIVSRVADLAVPVDLGSHHVAAGANFPEHAGESDVEDGPFLFAKLVEPTSPQADVAAGAGLLDYEVELAWVPLDELRRGHEAEHLGLILCNDYTDREVLLRHIDVWDVASADGFTTGKSFPGFLPVGNLFVIPADYRAFAEALELRLYVNGEERQRSRVSQAVWSFDDLIDQTWQWQERRWDHHGQPVALLSEKDVIAARTLIMGGTPSGTGFQGVSRRQQVAGVVAWLWGGWDRPVTAHVIDAYAARARVEKRFLQPGDRVVIHVDRMGVIDNRVLGTP
jgi:2-keto-4-pentenoate hydratase/2-oxohepta-3-ene-1,7-dioic acid hydratase in catechol pathway